MSSDPQAGPGPPSELRLAVEQFNRGEYFECHETLEALWRRESGPSRELYQGIIQLAVALHHVRGGNHKGAVSVLDKALPKLRRPPPPPRWIDMADRAEQAARVRDTLEALGPHGLDRFSWAEAPSIAFATDEP